MTTTEELPSMIQQTAQSNGVQKAETEEIDPDRLEFERNFDQPLLIASRKELLTGFIVLGAWFMVFAGGILVGTQHYITAITEGATFFDAARFSVIIFLFWTITNVGILSCLAAVLGAFGRRTNFTDKVFFDDVSTADHRLRSADAREVIVHYASAVMRGFGVYTLVLSGLLVLATDALIAPTQGQYVRMAALVSVISFYAGYDPTMFAGFLDRIQKFIENK